MSTKRKRPMRNYNEKALQEALTQIKSGTPLRVVSRTFNIPRGTLQDRIHGLVAEGTNTMGPHTILSKEEEKKIVDWLISLAKCGFPRNRVELLSAVQQIVLEDRRSTPFREGRPGKTWYHSFLKRHPELAIRAPENVSKGRAIITENYIRSWFSDLHDYLISIGAEDILEDPSRILNGDETSFAMVPKSGAIIAPKGARNVYQVDFGKEKETLTVLLVFTASGETLPPMVVFPYVRPPAAIINSMPNKWILGRSDSGWMRSDTFYEYVANGLQVWLNENDIKRPILFLVDGHKSHLSMALSEFCSSNGIILYALPPNTTHIMQPADVGAFKGLKSDYKKTVRTWQSLPENLGKAIIKSNFCQLLEDVLKQKDRTNIVQNAFRKCGLFPFNPNAVDYSKCIQDALETNATFTEISTSDMQPRPFSKAEYDCAKLVIESVKEELLLLNIDYKIINDVISTKSKLPDEESEIAETSQNVEGTYFLGNSGELVKISSDVSDTFSTLSDKANDKTLVSERDEIQSGTTIGDITNTTMDKPVAIDVKRRTSEVQSSSCTTLASKATSQVSVNFEKHLYYPQPIVTTIRRNQREKPPLSVSSDAGKHFYKEKERLQIEKKDKIRLNKEQRLKKRLERDAHKENRKPCKNAKLKKKTKINCPECHDEVLTDVEEDGLKNLGCDNCERWFHLQCTTLSNLTFDEAEMLDFTCTFCDY